MMNSEPANPIDAFKSILAHKTTDLPDEEVKNYVQKYFDRANFFTSILINHPLPAYVLETKVLKERARKFRAAFDGCFEHTGYYFAMKCNNYPDVAHALVKEGFGLDVSSGLELEAAIKTGTRDIVFSGPGKMDEELSLAADYKDQVIILVDSFNELSRVESISKKKNISMSIGVRLTTQSTGLWRKFGILPERLGEFWDITQNMSHIKLKGLQFHTSWNLSPEAQITFIKYLSGIFSQLPSKFKKQLKFIDIGGGYWPEVGEWLRHEGTREGVAEKLVGKNHENPLRHYRQTSVSIETFAEKLGEATQHFFSELFPIRICFEPGRWIVTDAMHLLLSVVDKKAEDLVITDAGTNTIGWERYETDYCPILNLTRPMLTEKECLVLGSLCTPHDVWGGSYWGENIQIGDVLMIPAQGAYTYSLRQNFIKPLPEVISI